MKIFEVQDYSNGKITNLPAAVGSGDAVPLNQVQALIASALATLDAKPTLKSVSTTNITLSGTQTVNGVSLGAGDACLVTGQSVPSQNGPYIVASGVWTRRNDDGIDELTSGAFFPIQSGTGATYDGTIWQLTTSGTITIGTTALTFKLQYNPNNTVNRFSQLVGDGGSTSITITHNLNNSYPVLQFFLVSTGEPIGVDWTVTSANVVTAAFLTAPASNALRVEILG